MDQPHTLIAVLAFIIGTYTFLLLQRKRSPSLAPGPTPFLGIGNLLDWPKDCDPKVFIEWAEKYGDIVHIRILGTHIIILNNLESANEILSSKFCSSRSHTEMAGKLIGFESSLVLSPYNRNWKYMKQILTPFVTKAACQRYHDQLHEQCPVFLLGLLKKPDSLVELIRCHSLKGVLSIVYGIHIDSVEDEFVQMSQRIHELIHHAILPGSFLVDVIPSLQYLPEWFPGASFKTLAREARITSEAMVRKPMDVAMDRKRQGEADDSIASRLLENPDVESNLASLQWACSSLYAASETLVSLLSTFFLMMASHPRIQKQAQEEIDTVVGDGRLPNFADRSDLPYINAILKECLRIHPPTPMGVPHQTTEDIRFKSFHIPKGTVVMPNMFSIGRDGRMYDRPLEFRPDRFLQVPPDPEPSFAYGFGRRLCIGSNIADLMLFITMATVLSTFNIDHDSEVTTPSGIANMFASNGFLSYPKSYPLQIRPRSKRSVELITSSLI